MSEATPDFLSRICDEAAASRKPFRPFARYEADGDFVEFVFRPDSFYEERVDDFLTVFRSEETRDVIGSVLKGIKKASRQSAGLQVLVSSGHVRLSHLLLWGITSANGEKRGIAAGMYEKLLTQAVREDAPADAMELCGSDR